MLDVDGYRWSSQRACCWPHLEVGDAMTFDAEFEESILAHCLRDAEYLGQASRLLDAHHFSTPQMGWTWSVIRNTWSSFAERTTPKVFKANAARDFTDDDERKAHMQLVVKLFRKKKGTPRTALGELEGYVRFVTLQVAIEQSVKQLERGKVDAAWDALRKSTLQDLRPKAFKMTRWMEEFADRQSERKHQAEHPEEYVCIPTGLPTLNTALEGGLRMGELGLIVATTNMGKSIAMNHLGYHGVIHDYGVAHFSLEMSADAVATRYDSRFTGMLHRKFKTWDFSGSELKEVARKVKRNKERLKNRLRIVSMPVRSCDINSLRNALDEIEMEMPVHMVLVDSGDHMKATRKHESIRLEHAEVYWDLKALAEERSKVVWSTTHAGREYEKKFAGNAAVSESYDKARIADAVLTLNPPGLRSRRSKVAVGEAPEPVAPGSKKMLPTTMEAFLSKNRDGVKEIRIPLHHDFSRMLIEEAEVGGAT